MNKLNHEEQLYKIFDNVNDWLKFAETKNAMIIGFNGASIYGISQVFNLDFIKSHVFINYYLVFIIIILIFSTISSLLSFVPRLKIVNGGLYGENSVSNILYFESLKIKTNTDILIELTGEMDKSKFSFFEKDMAEQIKQNSIIASIKYSYFTIAIWLTIAAYITPLVAGIFCLYTFRISKEDKNTNSQ